MSATNAPDDEGGSCTYPQVRVRLDAIRENTASIASRFDGDLAAVTKGVCGDPHVAEAMLDGGADWLADSRIGNLRRLDRRFDADRLLLRVPMASEVDEVARVADASLHSELDTLAALAAACRHQDTTHQVIVMVDVGDRREGVLPEDLPSFLGRAADLSGIEIAGIGTNFACMSGLQATPEKVAELREVAASAESALDREIAVVSAGGSAILPRLDDPDGLAGVTHLRIGEGILLGTEPTEDVAVSYLRQDAFEVSAQVVELKDKPATPDGKTAQAAFGDPPTVEDGGQQTRAIVAMGRQDVAPDDLVPVREDVSIVGASSDHTVLDVSAAEPSVAVGDRLAFRPGYGSLLQSFTSPYLRPRYR
jgi:predicted amino acid racemase